MFDVIVVGGGPAGLSAALMLGRCRRSVLVCDAGAPRNQRSRALHGYLTRDGIAPSEFNALGRGELAPYGVEFRPVSVRDARPRDAGFDVSLADANTERARFLLIATGVADDLPAIDGLSECYGLSVFHCPYCDGWEWRDRRIAVVGRGRHGGALALSLRTWSADVLLCTNGRRVPKEAAGRLARHDITVDARRIARLEHKRGMLRAVAFGDGAAIDRDVVFFSSSEHPQCDLAVNLGCIFNSRGTVDTGRMCETNVPGVFVAGDASKDAQFVVVAAAEGIKAAIAINEALQREETK
ncbi:MAG TPA: NAD(P)/FAD-dependent oxidoreductase [Vicinamibacterales bacterium]|jgi:thioredoxin reductase|nr:NAD(P)/FAD-dependent oxidoreductase [Vicinamibacterales bacterium]